MDHQQRRRNSYAEERTSSSRDNRKIAKYENLTAEGYPVPSLSRGVVVYRPDYINTEPSRSSWYDRLQVFWPMAVEWLRNTWGNVDERGHDVYDVMHHNVRQTFVLYDKLDNTAQVLFAGSGNTVYDTLEGLAQDDPIGRGTEENSSIYDTLERHSPMVLPTGSENALET